MRGIRLLGSAGLQGIRHRRGQRQGHVADAQPDNIRLRMLFLIGGHLLGNAGEEVAFLQ